MQLTSIQPVMLRPGNYAALHAALLAVVVASTGQVAAQQASLLPSHRLGPRIVAPRPASFFPGQEEDSTCSQLLPNENPILS